MTNPDNTVGTNAGFNGRTTPNAFNDILANYTGRGIINGWACSPKSGMTIQLGGNGSDRDVAIAEDNAGNKTTINNRTATPVEITLDGAPATNNRIDSIVAYVDNPQQGAGSTDVDFPSQVGIIAVKGTVAANPNAPTEAQIRTAITADGATGASAYYVVLANITVGTGVTTIGSGVITQGKKAVAGIMTAIDAAPSSDTPSAWATLLGGKPGIYITELTASRFTNQPAAVGVLRTTITSNYDRLEQEFTQLSGGVKYYRCGNNTGWWGQSGGSGAFRKIIDNGQSATVTSGMIDWTTLFVQATLPQVPSTTITNAWTATNIGSSTTVSGLVPSATYTIFATALFTESSGVGEFRLQATGSNTKSCNAYAPGPLCAIPYQLQGVKPNASGQVVLQRVYSGEAGTVRCSNYDLTFVRTA